jgi:glycerol-3-phosphate acyltransferase PlsY
MPTFLYLIPSALIGYLFGAIPFGYLYVRWLRGVDVRSVGSGRTGGTNSFRAGGMTAGLMTAVSDAVKGAVALLIVTLAFGRVLDATMLPWAQILAGVCSVVGHNWSAYLGFAGGAGTGPNVGWAMALWWPIAPISFLVVGGALRFVGIAAIASILMALVIPIVFAVRLAMGIDHSIAFTLGGILTLLIVVYSLRPNIKRMIEGRERKVGPRNRPVE